MYQIPPNRRHLIWIQTTFVLIKVCAIVLFVTRLFDAAFFNRNFPAIQLVRNKAIVGRCDPLQNFLKNILQVLGYPYMPWLFKEKVLTFFKIEGYL